MSMNHQIAGDSQAKPNVVSPRSSVYFPPAALATIGRLRALAVLLRLDADLADELVADHTDACERRHDFLAISSLTSQLGSMAVCAAITIVTMRISPRDASLKRTPRLRRSPSFRRRSAKRWFSSRPRAAPLARLPASAAAQEIASSSWCIVHGRRSAALCRREGSMCPSSPQPSLRCLSRRKAWPERSLIRPS